MKRRVIIVGALRELLAGSHRGRTARLRQTLGGRSGGPLVRSTVALVVTQKDRCTAARRMANADRIGGESSSMIADWRQ